MIRIEDRNRWTPGLKLYKARIVLTAREDDNPGTRTRAPVQQLKRNKLGVTITCAAPRQAMAEG